MIGEGYGWVIGTVSLLTATAWVLRPVAGAVALRLVLRKVPTNTTIGEVASAIERAAGYDRAGRPAEDGA